MSTHKKILIDVDGVCLDWESSFEEWVNRRGYHFDTENGYGHFRVSKRYNIDETLAMSLIVEFNHSAAAGFLKPLRDSVYYMKRLNEEHGYRFTAITSFGDDKYSVKLREMNLKHLFGDIFDNITCLPIGCHKEEALLQYKDSGLYWIEDHPKNAEIGRNLGLNSVVIQHDYNLAHAVGPDSFPMVKNWNELYTMITG
jgi:FMN phosphatase YigB (HAD superfamily)